MLNAPHSPMKELYKVYLFLIDRNHTFQSCKNKSCNFHTEKGISTVPIMGILLFYYDKEVRVSHGG